MFNSSRLDLLSNEERDDMTYRLATCYLKTGNVKEAAIWFETLRSTGSRYTADCTYYLAYIRYSQQRYDDALSGFLSLQDNAKYEALVPYYIAEIYLIKKNYDKAEIVAQNYLSAYPNQKYTGEMYRIQGTADYHFGKYHEAIKAFGSYLKDNAEPAPRCALYAGNVLLPDGCLLASSGYPGRGARKQRCAYAKRISAHGIGLLAACRQEQGAYGI